MSTATVSLGRLGVVDRHRQIVLPGALRNPGADVAVSPAQHSLLTLLNQSPVRDTAGALAFLASIRPAWAGIGKVREENGELVAEVTFDESDLGASVCEMVSAMQPDWSMGYAIPDLETREPTDEEKALGAFQVITGFTMIEMSPVDQGAGIAQGTLKTCCGACEAAGGKSRFAAVKCAGHCQAQTPVADGKCGSCALKRPTENPIDAAAALIDSIPKLDLSEAAQKELRRIASSIGKLLAPAKAAAPQPTVSQTPPPASPPAAAPTAPAHMDAAAQKALQTLVWESLLHHRKQAA